MPQGIRIWKYRDKQAGMRFHPNNGGSLLGEYVAGFIDITNTFKRYQFFIFYVTNSVFDIIDFISNITYSNE